MALITNTEFKALRDIGNKVNEQLLTECIALSEKNELLDILGNFYFDVLENKDNTGDKWEELMIGSTFTDSNNDTFTHEGVKALLADLAYSRYVNRVNADFTPFGLVHKEGQDSRVTDRNYIKDLAHQARKDADAKMRIIHRFLRENDTLFDRYFEEDNDVSIGQGRRRWSRL